MKTLLLRPFIDASGGTSPPLSLMYLSSFLKSRGVSVKLLDKCEDRTNIAAISLENPYIKKLCDEINDFGPDIIGMTLFSREITDIAVLCKLIKERFKSAYIVLGGPHPTVMPKETMKEIPECDFVVRGEGEITLYNLIHNIRNGLPFDQVRGICFRNHDSGEISQTENADILMNLDDIPFPDRETLMTNYLNNKYGSILYGIPGDIIMTSRGCPYQCSFCFKVCKKYRSRSPENVIKEIRWIYKNIAPQSIQIMDDSFTIEKDRCSKILDYLIEEKFRCDFKVRSRVNMVDEELLRKMKKAGVNSIVYGFESGSQSMLDMFNKGTTVEQNIKACKLTKKAGIKCFGDMILFYSGENRQTLRETEKFVKIARPTGLRFHILSPLPGTKVYEEAKRSGCLVGDWGIGKESPWIRLKDFKDVNEMERIAKKMFIKSVFNFAIIYSMAVSFAKNFYKAPFLFTKLIIYAAFKKNKY